LTRSIAEQTLMEILDTFLWLIWLHMLDTTENCGAGLGRIPLRDYMGSHRQCSPDQIQLPDMRTVTQQYSTA
jgi:hypothetical protein